MSKDIEVEIKFELKNPEQVIEFLNQNAKPTAQNITQKDTYFTPPHRNFIDIKYPYEWLRIRETPKGNYINYKHFYPENVVKTDYCDEFETDIIHPEAIKKIFNSLDVRELVVVEKSRSTWMFEDVEIAIDNVINAGVYIELELKKHFDDPKQGKEYLYNLLTKLNAQVGKEDLRGYPFIILEKQGYKFEE